MIRKGETPNKYIKALMEISRAITSEQYLEDILKLIVMVTAKVTGVEICSLWLVENIKDKKIIRLKATQAIDHNYVKDRTLDMEEGVVGYVASTKEPFIIENVLNEPIFKEKEMAEKLGLISMVGVPMVVKGEEIIGVLNCFTSIKYKFSETEVDLITTVANQAAVAIYNTKLIVEAKVIQEELEARKLIERAKDVLMRRSRINGNNIDGKEAFRWIQKRSMELRKSMREVSEAILLSEELY